MDLPPKQCWHGNAKPSKWSPTALDSPEPTSVFPGLNYFIAHLGGETHRQEMGTRHAPNTAKVRTQKQMEMLRLVCAVSTTTDLGSLDHGESSFTAWPVCWAEANCQCASRCLTLVIIITLTISARNPKHAPAAMHCGKKKRKNAHKNMNGPSRKGVHFSWLMAHPMIQVEPNPKC